MPENGILSLLSVVPKVLLAAAITVMDEFYYKLAVWLNDKGKSLIYVETFILMENNL